MKRITFIHLFIFSNLTVSGQNLPNDTVPKSEERLIEYETAPSFPGGEIVRICFFSNNLNHDIVSSKKLTEGKVYVRFEVYTIGSILEFSQN